MTHQSIISNTIEKNIEKVQNTENVSKNLPRESCGFCIPTNKFSSDISSPNGHWIKNHYRLRSTVDL